MNRLVVIGATLLVMVAGFAAMGAVRKQFFPTSARLELLVDVNLRQGASFAATLDAARRVEQALDGDEDALGVRPRVAP